MHQPIRQSIVITTRGAGNDAARRFVEALESQEGRAVLSRYGFTVDSP
ncbi:MAG: substrate-binding domain-containing protein [Actinomycetota bacterium]